MINNIYICLHWNEITNELIKKILLVIRNPKDKNYFLFKPSSVFCSGKVDICFTIYLSWTVIVSN